jgi:hypothetical protein
MANMNSSIPSEAEQNDQTRVYNYFHVSIALSAIIIFNFLLRHYIEQSPYYFKETCFGGFVISVKLLASMKWWEYLLPMKDIFGLWSPTGIIPIFILEKFIPPCIIYYILNVLLILVGFFISNSIFKNPFISLTIAFCLAVTTHNYHIYYSNGVMERYLTLIYFQFTAFCHYNIIKGNNNRILWKGLSLISVIILALSFEGWLDYPFFLWLCSPILILVFYRSENRDKIPGLLFVTGTTTAIALLYLVVKMQMGTPQLKGTELDLVFNYDHVCLAIEDVISNWITYFYMTITNFFPPSLISSNSLQRLTAHEIVESMNNYPRVSPRYINDLNDPLQHLAYYHHLFLWRYYAGILFAIFFYIFIKVTKQTLKKYSINNIILFLLVLLILIGSPMHSMFKFRFYLAAPYLTYKLSLSILALIYLIAYLLAQFTQSNRSILFKRVVVTLTYLIILYSAFRKPVLLNVLARELNVGSYPYPLGPIKLFLLNYFY